MLFCIFHISHHVCRKTYCVFSFFKKAHQCPNQTFHYQRNRRKYIKHLIGTIFSCRLIHIWSLVGFMAAGRWNMRLSQNKLLPLMQNMSPSAIVWLTDGFLIIFGHTQHLAGDGQCWFESEHEIVWQESLDMSLFLLLYLHCTKWMSCIV